MSDAKTMTEVEALRAEIAKLKAAASARVTLKVSEPRAPGTHGPDDKGSAGGALSVYGLNRFPVTLKRSQWEILLSLPIKEFIRDNASKLTA